MDERVEADVDLDATDPFPVEVLVDRVASEGGGILATQDLVRSGLAEGEFGKRSVMAMLGNEGVIFCVYCWCCLGELFCRNRFVGPLFVVGLGTGTYK